MLSYAFRILQHSNYESLAAEEFSHTEDLFAAILAKGVSRQLKQGLYKEYICKEEELSILKGKLSLQGTIRNRIQRKPRLSCEYDELTENNIYNQILKTAMVQLVRNSNVKKERKVMLNKLLIFFSDVFLVDPKEIEWRRLEYHRENRNYEMLMNICYFLMDGMIHTTEDGMYKAFGFTEEHMARLYEKFILEYYKQHYAGKLKAKAAQVKWNLTGENEESMIRFLPEMQTDIMLQKEDRILIIDAKYYGKTMQEQFDKKSLHSSHVYQIFAYVKNQDKNQTGKVSGLLLYAKTGESITPDYSYEIGGSRIGAKTLDLNCEFERIKEQLDEIAAGI